MTPMTDRCFSRILLVAAIWLFSTDYVAAQTKPRRYVHGSDSIRQTDVPKGTLTQHRWIESSIYPNTKRRFYVYVPAQYDPEKPAALMVFQDGHAYVNENGDYRATIVMDNLIHQNQIPVTIGLFVDPGHLQDELPPNPGWKPQPKNRSLEYDTLNDTYSKFLLGEIIPQVEKDYNITNDPNGRAICGASSGGICAFTVAWERPDQFSKVVSHIGSFTNIRHGDTYPGIIRKSNVKSIRVYLQDGSNDLDNLHGNWPLANQQMMAALKFKKYDVRFDFGEGGHNGNHAGSLFPDALRWIWRDYGDVQPQLAILPDKQSAVWAVKWWLPRHHEKLAQRKSMKQVDLLMIGDSITHGWENSGKPVWDKYYAHRNALNLGFSGDRTEHVIWRIQNGAVDDIDPKLAVIMIGTNNTGHRKQKPEETAEGIQRVIRELQMRLPKTKILLLAVFPRGDDKNHELRKINEAINDRIENFADNKSVWFLNLNSQFLVDQSVLPKSIMPDLLHPNEKGYAIWAEAMESTIKALMDEPR